MKYHDRSRSRTTKGQNVGTFFVYWGHLGKGTETLPSKTPRRHAWDANKATITSKIKNWKEGSNDRRLVKSSVLLNNGRREIQRDSSRVGPKAAGGRGGKKKKPDWRVSWVLILLTNG